MLGFPTDLYAPFRLGICLVYIARRSIRPCCLLITVTCSLRSIVAKILHFVVTFEEVYLQAWRIDSWPLTRSRRQASPILIFFDLTVSRILSSPHASLAHLCWISTTIGSTSFSFLLSSLIRPVSFRCHICMHNSRTHARYNGNRNSIRPLLFFFLHMTSL